MMRYLYLVLSVSLLAACFGGGEVVPQDKYYHLADISGNVTKAGKSYGVIAVVPLQSDALHHERTILYSLQSAPLTVKTYYYHHWSNTPGQMIQEQLIAYLRAAGFAHTVIRYGERARIDGQVSGYIQRFERIVGTGRPKVLVRLELSFDPRSSNAQLALTKVYSSEQVVADDSMEATAEAFSSALQTIYARFVADVTH